MVCFTAATNARVPLVWTFGWNNSCCDFAFVKTYMSLYEMSWTRFQQAELFMSHAAEARDKRTAVNYRDSFKMHLSLFPCACVHARSSPYSPPKAERVTERWRETCNIHSKPGSSQRADHQVSVKCIRLSFSKDKTFQSLWFGLFVINHADPDVMKLTCSSACLQIIVDRFA